MNYRLALPHEASQIGPLILQASKLTRLLYSDLNPGKSSLQSLIEDVSRKDPKCSYTRCLLALDGKQVVGVANFYPSEEHRLTEEMKHRFTPEKIGYISPVFSSQLPRSFYISALAVDPSKQGYGIGKTLIEKIEQIGKETNRTGISLHCWINNIPAIQFYKKLSFSILETLDLGPHPLIPYQGSLALLFR